MTDHTAGQREPSAPSRGSLCIRDAREAMGEPPVPCGGHYCYGCGRTFYCGERHVCSSRPQRCETGIERTPTTFERLAAGMKMLGRE